MPSTTTLLILLAPILLFTAWHISSTLSPPPIPLNLQNKRIILLIAHPDDESMFFSPTLQALTNPSLGNHVKILCLSTGNADGLGETRRKELESAALTLGLRQSQDVFVMDDERFKDGMKEEWAARDIARVLAQAFAPQLIINSTQPSVAQPSEKTLLKDRHAKPSSGASKSSSKSKPTSKPASPAPAPSSPASIAEGPKATIDILLTFDSSGISSHPNHISLYHGARLFLTHIMKNQSGYKCPVDLYTLTTVNIARKYSFFLDVLPTYIAGILGSMMDGFDKKSGARSRKDDRVVFISDIRGYLKAREAMVHGHKSQMVWFRWGWIGLGRYMVVNDLKREVVIAS